jgi:hypothetical protein
MPLRLKFIGALAILAGSFFGTLCIIDLVAAK